MSLDNIVVQSLVIISQGKFKDGSRAINIASELRKKFVDVFAVPIGDSPDLKTLVKVVNKPIENNIFMTTSANALTPNARALTRTICQGAQKIKSKGIKLIGQYSNFMYF